MFEELNQHRAAVEEQIQKGFEIGFTGNELEKAHKVGDIHPNGKWVWTQLPSGRYDWRVIKKTAGNVATSAPQATANGKKSWDNASDFSINGSDEARLVANWSNFMKRKDPHYMNVMREIFQKKFPAVAKWVQTSPNTGVSEIRAIDSNKKEVATLNLSNGVKIPEIQRFMDACDKVKKEPSTSQQHPSKKPSSFISKTVQMIKDRFGYGYNSNCTDEKVQKLQDSLTEHEEVAKKIMSTTFPAASWGMGGGKRIKVTDTDEFIFETHASTDTTSRNPSFYGGTDYHYTISCKIGNSEKVIASASHSSRSKWSTASEAKNDCKIDALIRYLHISL